MRHTHKLSNKVKRIARRYDVCFDGVFGNRRFIRCSLGAQIAWQHIEIRMCLMDVRMLSAGTTCIGQTRRCVNDRLRGHNACLKGAPSGHSVAHVRDCCRTPPILKKKKKLEYFQYASRRAREEQEAWEIANNNEEKCINVETEPLSEGEPGYLRSAAKLFAWGDVRAVETFHWLSRIAMLLFGG